MTSMRRTQSILMGLMLALCCSGAAWAADGPEPVYRTGFETSSMIQDAASLGAEWGITEMAGGVSADSPIRPEQVDLIDSNDPVSDQTQSEDQIHERISDQIDADDDDTGTLPTLAMIFVYGSLTAVLALVAVGFLRRRSHRPH